MSKENNPLDRPRAPNEDNPPQILLRLDTNDIKLFRQLARTHQDQSARRLLLHRAGVDAASLPAMGEMTPEDWWEATRITIESGKFGDEDATIARLIEEAHAGHRGERTYKRARAVLLELGKATRADERANVPVGHRDARPNVRRMLLGLGLAVLISAAAATAWLIPKHGEQEHGDADEGSSTDIDADAPPDLPETNETSTDTGGPTTGDGDADVPPPMKKHWIKLGDWEDLADDPLTRVQLKNPSPDMAIVRVREGGVETTILLEHKKWERLKAGKIRTTGTMSSSDNRIEIWFAPN
jgi:hypothetical protein